VNLSKNKHILLDVIEESFGGASGGGAGTFAWAQQTGAMDWRNNKTSPRNRNSTSDSLGYNVKDISEEEEEFTHPAPKLKPFPLDNIATSLVNSFIALSEANMDIKICLKNNVLVSDHTDANKILNKQFNQIEKIKNAIKKVSLEMDTVTF